MTTDRREKTHGNQFCGAGDFKGLKFGKEKSMESIIWFLFLCTIFSRANLKKQVKRLD
jgi:hypothetical protein